MGHVLNFLSAALGTMLGGLALDYLASRGKVSQPAARQADQE